MPALAAVVEKEVFASEITPMFNELSADHQESVREIAVENMVRLERMGGPRRDGNDEEGGRR